MLQRVHAVAYAGQPGVCQLGRQRREAVPLQQQLLHQLGVCCLRCYLTLLLLMRRAVGAAAWRPACCCLRIRLLQQHCQQQLLVAQQLLQPGSLDLKCRMQPQVVALLVRQHRCPEGAEH